MLDFTPDQHQKLQDIAKAIKTTRYGRNWPREYRELFQRWGFFNSIYNILHTNKDEWERIQAFALDDRFSHIWDVLVRHSAIRELAWEHQTC